MHKHQIGRVRTTRAAFGLALLGVLVQGGTCPPPPPPPPSEVDVTIEGQGTVDQSANGSNVTLTAEPATGWLFDRWTDADLPDSIDPTDPEITVNARQITEITAVFIPDSDRDGVPDRDDRCPATPTGATPDAEGCAVGSEPDSDDDGVSDDADECPNTPRTVPDEDIDSRGCPIGDPTSGDDDNDTVPNNIDQCPNTPTGSTVDANGCADSERDSDGDGVLDSIDECPNTPERTEVDATGCPTDDGGNGNGDDPVCGNGVRETGEQCDDGNRNNGDGCDSDCQNEPPPGGLENNACANATAVTDGSTDFNNVGATTDGPDEPQQCDFFNRTQVESDVWFCYTATCTGDALFSLCGSEFDTKMAVYNGCTCPSSMNTAARCSDDDCGSGVENVQSRVTLAVVQGQQYLVRIGGFLGDQGDGQLNITCGGGDVCLTATTDCLAAAENNAPGCADEACCDAVCEVDQFCCDITWDEFCAAEAEGICDGSFEVCVETAAACTAAGTEPGCNNVSCCNDVCERDPFCCIDRWDQNCVSEANAFCALSCGSRAGDCFVTHDTPGCNLTACCQLVCPEDPFCCDTEWDGECVVRARSLCQ